MKSLDVINAFSEREILDREISSSEFEDMACSLARLIERDQLNLLPLLMIYILKHQDDGRATNYGEMIVFCLMPQPDGWKNLIDDMSVAEVDATLKWLICAKNFPFSVNCMDELRLAIELFNERSDSGKMGCKS